MTEYCEVILIFIGWILLTVNFGLHRHKELKTNYKHATLSTVAEREIHKNYMKSIDIWKIGKQTSLEHKYHQI